MSDILSRDIFGDLEAGDEAMSLADAVRLPALRRGGRAHHVSWVHRAADPKKGCAGSDGQRVVLETITNSGRMLTTQSAVMRFLRRQNTQISATPQDVRTHAAAKASLARAGI